MSLHGVRTIAVLELRQRLRTSRWLIVVGIWFLLIGAVAGLTKPFLRLRCSRS